MEVGLRWDSGGHNLKVRSHTYTTLNEKGLLQNTQTRTIKNEGSHVGYITVSYVPVVREQSAQGYTAQGSIFK